VEPRGGQTGDKAFKVHLDGYNLVPFLKGEQKEPFERADESGSQFQTANQLYFIAPGQAVVAKWLSSFKEVPPRQKPARFNVDAVLEKIASAAAQGPGR
jgi:arylsulfatase